MPTNTEMVKLSIGLAIEYMNDRPFIPSLFKKAMSIGGNAVVRDNREILIFGYPISKNGVEEINFEFRDYLNRKRLVIVKDGPFILIKPI